MIGVITVISSCSEAKITAASRARSLLACPSSEMYFVLYRFVSLVSFFVCLEPRFLDYIGNVLRSCCVFLYAVSTGECSVARECVSNRRRVKKMGHSGGISLSLFPMVLWLDGLGV